MFFFKYNFQTVFVIQKSDEMLETRVAATSTCEGWSIAQNKNCVAQLRNSLKSQFQSVTCNVFL